MKFLYLSYLSYLSYHLIITKMSDKKCACGICESKAGDAECTICSRHLCHSIRKPQSACSNCIIEAIEKKALKKNDKKQWLDPLQFPLPTCICGEFIMPMSDCLFKMMAGDKGHKIIQ